IKTLWLVDIHKNGEIAYRVLPGFSTGTDSTKVLEKCRADFKPTDYKESNFENLKASLKQALIESGLFADEAQAMLDTWQISYFKSSGSRVFFIVPRDWTDHYLPLKVSVPAKNNRVMVGRIELITPEQKKLLKEIA